MSALAKQFSEAPAELDQGADRRLHQWVELVLTGRFLCQNGDHPLETADVSCGGATIVSDVQPDVGAPIVCYFDNFGRVNGRVVRHCEHGFAVAFDASPRKRDKLADRLTWLMNAASYNLSDERIADRIQDGSEAQVTLSDGSIINCRVSDISLTGACFQTVETLPLVGDIVGAGKLKGEVVRSTPGEFAIRFLHGTEAENPAA